MSHCMQCLGCTAFYNIHYLPLLMYYMSVIKLVLHRHRVPWITCAAQVPPAAATCHRPCWGSCLLRCVRGGGRYFLGRRGRCLLRYVRVCVCGGGGRRGGVGEGGQERRGKRSEVGRWRGVLGFFSVGYIGPPHYCHTLFSTRYPLHPPGTSSLPACAVLPHTVLLTRPHTDCLARHHCQACTVLPLTVLLTSCTHCPSHCHTLLAL